MQLDVINALNVNFKQILKNCTRVYKDSLDIKIDFFLLWKYTRVYKDFHCLYEI